MVWADDIGHPRLRTPGWPGVGQGQTLTELRAEAPTALIPIPRELNWQPVACDAPCVAIQLPAGTNDVMCAYKLNTFHWHLTDHAGSATL